jgi:hypothetical protein
MWPNSLDAHGSLPDSASWRPSQPSGPTRLTCSCSFSWPGSAPTGSVRRVGDSNYTRIRFRGKDRMRPKPPCWCSWVARKNYLALLRLDWARRLNAF